jgi:hypothetical protein
VARFVAIIDLCILSWNNKKKIVHLWDSIFKQENIFYILRSHGLLNVKNGTKGLKTYVLHFKAFTNLYKPPPPHTLLNPTHHHHHHPLSHPLPSLPPSSETNWGIIFL